MPLTKRRGSAEAGLRRELADIGEPPVQFKSVAIQLQLLSNSHYYPIPVTIQFLLLSKSRYCPITVTIPFQLLFNSVNIQFQLLYNSRYYPIPATTYSRSWNGFISFLFYMYFVLFLYILCSFFQKNMFLLLL